MSTRKMRMYEILENLREDDPIALWTGRLLMALIMVSVMATIFETVKSLHDAYRGAFFVLEAFCVAVFSLEYLLRLWSCTAHPKFHHSIGGRLRYMFKPMMIIDLLSILPFFLPFLLPDMRFLRVLRMFRLFRLFKLARYSESLMSMRNVLMERREDLWISLATILFLLVFASSGMYFIENSAQPNQFSSIPAAMWWGVATLTTVGYGDVAPITPLGKLLGAVIAILGIGMFALPAGILASGFGEEVRLRKKRREERRARLMEELHGKAKELSQEATEQLLDEMERLHQEEEAARELVREAEAAQREAALLASAEVIEAVKRAEAAVEEEEAAALKEPPSQPWCYCPHCGGKLPKKEVKAEV